MWFDIKPVQFISTETDLHIVCSTLRRVSGHYECLSQPLIANHYNYHFKLVDVSDFLSTKYQFACRSYRSWRYVFNFCVQAAVVNAFIIYMAHNKSARNKTYSQWELGKKLIGSFTSRQTIPRVEPLIVGPDNKNEKFINHQNTRMPNSHSRVCKTHITHFSKK